VGEDTVPGTMHRRFLSSGALRTCTTGGYKFEEPYLFSLIDMLPQVLNKTGGSHLHIGPLSLDCQRAIRRELKVWKIEEDRFVLIDYVRSLRSAFEHYEVDLYLDSFPLCGCLSVVEAMYAGVPTIVHKNYRSPLFSNKNFVYPEAYCWDFPEELYDYVASVDTKVLLEQSAFAKRFYQLRHTPKTMIDALLHIERPESIPTLVAPLPYYRDECLEFFEWRKLEKQNASEQEALAEVGENEVDSVDMSLLPNALQTILRACGEDKLERRTMSELLYAHVTRVYSDRKVASISALDGVAMAVYEFLQTLKGDGVKAEYALLSKLLFQLTAKAEDDKKQKVNL
jgi:hypothetical protein